MRPLPGIPSKQVPKPLGKEQVGRVESENYAGDYNTQVPFLLSQARQPEALQPGHGAEGRADETVRAIGAPFLIPPNLCHTQAKQLTFSSIPCSSRFQCERSGTPTSQSASSAVAAVTILTVASVAKHRAMCPVLSAP